MLLVHPSILQILGEIRVWRHGMAQEDLQIKFPPIMHLWIM